MEITYIVGRKSILARACDICGAHKKPKDGIEISRKSTISSFGKIPVFHYCAKCGRDKFDEDVFE